MSIRARILGVSVWGPGLDGWAASRAVLAGEARYVSAPTAPPAPNLPAAERRRCGPVVRLALAAAQEAAGPDAGELHAVFASSTGDGPVVGAILDALTVAEKERSVSPTQFHNSVHNAAAGYWSIANASRQPATCLGCHDETWAAGLIAAGAELAASGAPVLLCCYDHPLPAPLDRARPMGAAFAAAIVLDVGNEIEIDYSAEPVVASEVAPELAALARSSPAARALALLCALARGERTTLAWPYLGGGVTLRLGS